MEMSQTFLNIKFLNSLRNVSPTIRYQMIQNMTPGQRSAIVEVALHVINRLIPTLLQDRHYFGQYRLVLRRLVSSRVSSAMKNRTLLHYHNTTIVPRLLAIFYLVSTIRRIARSREV